MKYIFKILALTLTVLAIILTTGCGVTERHTELVIKTLEGTDYAAFVENLQVEDAELAADVATALAGTVSFADAAGEIAEQRAGGGKTGSTITYDLTLTMPNLPEIDPTLLGSDYPEIDWNNVTRTSYSLTLYEKFVETLTDLLAAGECPTRTTTLTVTMTREGGKWNAQLDEATLRTLFRELMTQSTDLFESYRLAGNYLSVVAAERVNRAIAAETRYPIIFSNTTVTKLEGFDDGSYEVTLNTLDYVELIPLVTDKAYEDYKATNPDGVYAPPGEAIATALLKSAMDSTTYSPVLVEITLTSEDEKAETICDLIAGLIDDQLEIEAEDLIARIRSNLIIESTSEPRTQYYGTSNPKTGIPLKIYTPSGYDSHYFKIYDTTNGDLVQRIYVREGDSITVYLPVGSYRIRYCTGKTWYGYDHLFGPEGQYVRFEEILKMEKNNHYTLTLYQNNDANMEANPIAYDSF
ncbi:MAG: hypothetical protein IKZ21_02465 [Clostridia bacterium]|nr:hypothetical protein [Clostridia bacterium]